MGLNVTGYAKIWEVKEHEGGKVAIVRLTSSNRKQDGTYETDYSESFARFVGKAHEKAQTLKGDEFINILSGRQSVTYNKEKRRVQTGLTVFDFEVYNRNGSAKTTAAPKKSPVDVSVPEGMDEELPFN